MSEIVERDGATPPDGAQAKLKFEDFARLDIRVGTIVGYAHVPNKDRLVHLQVNIGEPEPRQVIAGIREAYPEDLTGRQITVVCNLEPRKMAGVTSTAMLLAAKDETGLRLIVPERHAVDGTKVG